MPSNAAEHQKQLQEHRGFRLVAWQQNEEIDRPSLYLNKSAYQVIRKQALSDGQSSTLAKQYLRYMALLSR